MADVITGLSDDDIRTEWQRTTMAGGDDDATDTGADGADTDDDASDTDDDDDASDSDADQTDS
ncbi:MAG TPA: hypothetical protein VMN58_04400 [Acidimicrobiales bacterium]|nr:hypothetical protein [Acidimicrobiales bacterium]